MTMKLSVYPRRVRDLFAALSLRRTSAGRVHIYLRIANVDGSVQHYYHFLLGFLAPLALFADACERENARALIHVRSCEPLDGLLREARFPNVIIHDPVAHHEGLEFPPGDAVETVTIGGFDHPRFYDRAILNAVEATMRARLHDAVAHETAALRKKLRPKK